MTVTKDLEWKDISDEKFRVYFFPINSEETARVVISNPSKLNYNPISGGHRVIDKNGGSWYIPSGWIALYWEGFEKGEPQYAF